MTQDDLPKVKKSELSAFLIAIRQAATLARETAILTDTAIVLVRDGKLVHISAA